TVVESCCGRPCAANADAGSAHPISPRASRLVVIDQSLTVPVTAVLYPSGGSSRTWRGSEPDSTLTPLAPNGPRHGYESRLPLASVCTCATSDSPRSRTTPRRSWRRYAVRKPHAQRLRL